MIHAILIPALVEGEWSALRRGRCKNTLLEGKALFYCDRITAFDKVNRGTQNAETENHWNETPEYHCAIDRWKLFSKRQFSRALATV
jgi:hypothetical protein